MKIYSVGGSVRDELLGLPVKDRDYVVVGATPEEMIAEGFRPVGADFPVFLHPTTHDEYALARTERKTAPGYKGFVFHTSPDVTIEEDLQRRDLTINAMARSEDGALIDPLGGNKDLEARILRHASAAFIEDPVRILRVARFAARFAKLGFTIADETMALMRKMVAAGEVDHLVPERVWQELETGLAEQVPSKMFAALRDCGALARILPELDRLFGVPQSATSHPEIDTGVHVMMVVDFAATKDYSLPVRFAALTHDLGKGLTAESQLPRHHGHETRSVKLVELVCERLKAPSEFRDLAKAVARWHGSAHDALKLKPSTLLDLFDGTDALRRPARFDEFVNACACDHHGRLGFADVPYPQAQFLRDALTELQSIDYASVSKQAQGNIADSIRQAKLDSLSRFIQKRTAT